MEYHVEERTTVFALERYIDAHPSQLLTLTFAEGDCYVCRIFTAYDFDNDLDSDDPAYDEFHEIAFLIVQTVVDGPNKEDGYGTVLLNYRHFPELIVAEDGTEVYRREGYVG